MSRSVIWDRAAAVYQRRAARWFGRRPFHLPPGRAMVSFSFDDFPRSALIEGGAILERFRLAGTYYTALGLAGRHTECGEMFRPEDLHCLVELGHELGCHTFDHCPAWRTTPVAFESSVMHNAAALDQLLPGAQFRTLSYPISYPRPDTKHRVGRRFACCRGGGQAFNTGTIDLNYVSAFFLEQSLDEPDAVKRAMNENQSTGGWLIFATHDITEQPTRFGCTPQFFEQVVRYAVDSGVEILPVGRAFDALRARAGTPS